MMKAKIGLTGGIGSGKSFVCEILRQRGIAIYNCDNEAKRLMAESSEIRSKLNSLLNGEAYTLDEANGTHVLNKAAIAKFLFASKLNAETINGIVHPVVKSDFLSWAERQQGEIVAQESAILFESGFDSTVDFTVEVYAPKKLRMERAMKRDSATENQIEARMAQQMPEEEKRERADFCIVNDGKSDLQTQIESMLRAITAKLAAAN